MATMISILAVYFMAWGERLSPEVWDNCELCYAVKEWFFLLYFISDRWRWVDRKMDGDGWISFFQMSDVFFLTFFTLPAHTLPGFKRRPLFTSSSSSYHHCSTATVVPPCCLQENPMLQFSLTWEGKRTSIMHIATNSLMLRTVATSILMIMMLIPRIWAEHLHRSPELIKVGNVNSVDQSVKKIYYNTIKSTA